MSSSIETLAEFLKNCQTPDTLGTVIGTVNNEQKIIVNIYDKEVDIDKYYIIKNLVLEEGDQVIVSVSPNNQNYFVLGKAEYKEVGGD